MLLSVIIVDPNDLWEYYEEHEFELENHMHEVANSYEYGVNIYVTKECGVGEIAVYVDDEELYTEVFSNKKECDSIACEIYNLYLSSDYVNSEYKFDLEEDNYDDEIDIREETLDYAVIDFLDAVFETSPGSVAQMDIDDVIQDLKNHFLAYMYRKWGMDIYRPTYLIDENGEEFLEEYPYSHMVFDK